MASPFIGQVLMFGGNFQITGWAFCQGQLMSIAQNNALFALIGTTYGGDGQSTFALPDLRSRVPIHQGTLAGGGTYTIGQQAGVENVTLIASQIPAHNHLPNCNSVAGTSANPAGNIWSLAPNLDPYSNAPTGAVMKATAVGNAPVGGPQPHNNIIPYQTLNYLIALQGIFPSRN